MPYIGAKPVIEFTTIPSKDSFTGDGSTTTFDVATEIATGGENALEVFVNNVRQEPGTGKAFTLGPDGSNATKRITFTAAPASGAAIYVINDKTNYMTLINPKDLNGVELILDADADTSITADTDDRIDIRIAATDHISFGTSSGDTVIKQMTDAKDIVFQQYDGNKILEINDGNYVAISGAAAGPGELRFYEDTDNGVLYTGFKAGNVTSSVSYVLPLADGTDGYQLATDGSGNLSWAAAGTTFANDGNNRVVTGTGSATLNGEANLTFDGSTLAVTGAATVSTTLGVTGVATFGTHVVLGDSDILKLGASTDLTLYHDGTNSYITNAVGALKVATETSGIAITIGHTTSETTVADNLTVTGDFAANNFKFAGTNFTGSLLVGHSTTGTLNAATYNTGVGLTALDAITSGDTNTAVGYGAMGAQTTGSNNVAVGSNAMLVSANGQYNVALGHNTMLAATSGNNNIAIGENSLLRATSPGNNVAVGSGALLAALSSASGNIALGYQAGNNITTGDGNVVIGNGDVASATGDKQFKISDGGDGSVVWMTGDSSANITFAATVSAATAFVPDAQDGAALGTTSLQFSDLFLADGAVIGLGDNNEVTLTHVHDTGLLLNTTMVVQFRDSAINIGSPADGDLDINADDEIELNSTLIDINGNVEISGTATTTGVHTFTAVPVFPNNTVELADIQADAVDGTKIADDAIDSEHYTDGSIDNAHIADDAIDSEHYAAGSIDTAHIADDQITLAKMASGTDGNLITYDASGNPAAVVTGSSGQLLTSAGAGAPPTFTTVVSGTSWQAVKTGDFTAAAGQGVFVNTTGAAITITLPAGSIGNEVSIIDYAGTFDSNNCTIAANGSEKIHSSTDDLTVATERAAFKLVFTDSTQGWLLTNN